MTFYNFGNHTLHMFVNTNPPTIHCRLEWNSTQLLTIKWKFAIYFSWSKGKMAKVIVFSNLECCTLHRVQLYNFCEHQVSYNLLWIGMEFYTFADYQMQMCISYSGKKLNNLENCIWYHLWVIRKLDHILILYNQYSYNS